MKEKKGLSGSEEDVNTIKHLHQKRKFSVIIVFLLILLCCSISSGSGSQNAYAGMAKQMIDLIEHAGEKNGEPSEIILLVQDDITRAFYGNPDGNQSYSLLTMIETAAQNQIAILSQYGVSELAGTWTELDNLGQILSGDEFRDETGWNRGVLNFSGMADINGEEKTVLYYFSNFLDSPVPFQHE